MTGVPLAVRGSNLAMKNAPAPMELHNAGMCHAVAIDVRLLSRRERE